MTRPIDSGAEAAAAAARAAAEAARRAAEAAARKAAEQEAARARAAQTNQVRPQTAPQDEFQTQTRAPVELSTPSTPAATAEQGKVPEKPEDLPRLFPELKNAPKEKLKTIHESMTKLTTGTFSEKAEALGKLAKDFPDTTKNVLDKLGVKDSKLAKLATNSAALASLSTLTDPKKSVAEKAQAALELAKTTGDTFKPEELKGVLDTVLKGLPAGAKLAGAIATFTDPSKTPIEKAKATLELAGALKDFAGDAFPKLANDLRKLDGTFRAVNSAITLLDPKASAQDKALAAAQLAADLPDLKKDLTAFKDVLKQAGVKGADDAVDQGVKLADVAVKGLDPALASKLSPEQLTKLQEVATKVGPDQLDTVLKGIKDPKALDSLVGQLGKLDAAAGKRLLTSLGGMEHGALAKVLGDPKMAEQLGSLATKLDDEGAKLIGKLAKDMDVGGLGTLLKLTDNVSADALKGGLKVLGPILEKGEGKLVGQGLKALDTMLGKMGVKITGEVAEKVFKNLAKVVPFVGAVPAALDAAKYAQESMELRDKNKDLGYFALVGAKLNAADAVVGTALDLTGVGAAVNVGVGALFGVAELALDLAFDSEKAKFKENPEGYQAPGWMKAINLAAAAATGPQGMAELAAYYGPEGAAQLTQWGIETGAKGALDVAKFAGVSAANATGDQLKMTAGFIRQMADVVRNPTKYGEAAANAARDALNTAIEKGGELATEAKKVVGEVIDEAKKLGQQGLDTLKFIAQNPGPVAQMAVDGIKNMVASGIDLATEAGKATYKKAVETLEGLKAGWETLKGAAKEKAKELINSAGQALGAAVDKAVELGEKGVELVTWAATHPGEVADKAKKAVGDALAKGGEIARKTWDSIRGLGDKGLALAESAVKSLKEAGSAAVETLKYVAENPGAAANQVREWVGQTLTDMARKGGEAAKAAATAVKDFVDRRVDWAKKFAVDMLKEGVASFKEVAKAWKDNLTEGGKELLGALKDLGSAGVDALKDLASVGGQLAQTAVGYLGDLANAGVDAAKGALNTLAQLGGEVGRLANGAFNAVKNATNGEINVGPIHVDLNPLW